MSYASLEESKYIQAFSAQQKTVFYLTPTAFFRIITIVRLHSLHEVFFLS